MCFLIRLSAIPTHVSTVLFAVCELPVGAFALKRVVSLALISVVEGGGTAGKVGDGRM